MLTAWASRNASGYIPWICKTWRIQPVHAHLTQRWLSATNAHRAVASDSSTSKDPLVATPIVPSGLAAFIDSALENVSKIAAAKAFQYPLVSLNSEKESVINLLITELSARVKSQPETEKLEQTVLLPVEFINPAIGNAKSVLAHAHSGTLPPNLLAFYDCTRTQLATRILTRLLYKLWLAHKTRTLPPALLLVDLRNPMEWFPGARRMRRKIIMHVGPTNSGKTYRLLQRLASAKSGYYAGPLRLLAREVFERFNYSDRIPCNLITGEQVIPVLDEFGHVSGISLGTIEMIPLNKPFDVCVIDEIQMIADPSRGLAWTNALLGVLAKEIHLCGEESAVPLVQRIAATTGDEIVVNTYDRMGKLTVCKEHILRITDLKRGDCVVAFSKRKILEYKCRIEQATRLKVGIIYGALPPEIRLQEAQRFNSGEYDVLVASDAVGMGLNLKIKRIVFMTIQKFDGSSLVTLTTLEIKQIAGRAGRYLQDAGELEGFVLAMSKKDLEIIRKNVGMPVATIPQARIWPTPQIWKNFMQRFPGGTPISVVMKKFEEEASASQVAKDPIYALSEVEDKVNVSQLLMRDNLHLCTTFDDQLLLSNAPFNTKMALPQVINLAVQFFASIAHGRTTSIFDHNFLHRDQIAQGPRISSTMNETVDTLQALEDNHRQVLLFLWLSQRWPTIFVDRESATDMKSLIEKRIGQEILNLRRVNEGRGRRNVYI